MQSITYTRDELVLEAHPDEPYILYRRQGEPGSVRIYLNEVRYLVDAIRSMAAEVAELILGDEPTSDDRDSA